MQNQGGSQEARRYTGTTVIQDVQRGELLVAKQLTPLAGQETVEGLRTDEVPVEVIALEQTKLVRTYTKHIDPPNHSSALSYHISRLGRGFRLDF